MPARDLYHEEVRQALLVDNWQITDDPLRLRWGKRDLYVDLGAEQLLAAEKGSVQIAVEIKSFLGASVVADLENALGQYMLYHDIMEEIEPGRELYLAITEDSYDEIFDEPLGQILLQKKRLQLLIFDPHRKVIQRWIPAPPIALSSSES